MGSTRGQLGSDRGQSIVETALSVPLLAAMLVGTLEASRLLLATVALTSGVLAGAQYGALSSTSAADTTGIATAVRSETTPIGGTSSNPTVTSSTATDGNGETYVTVSSTYSWSSLFKFPGLPQTVSITRSAVTQVRR